MKNNMHWVWIGVAVVVVWYLWKSGKMGSMMAGGNGGTPASAPGQG